MKKTFSLKGTVIHLNSLAKMKHFECFCLTEISKFKISR